MKKLLAACRKAVEWCWALGRAGGRPAPQPGLRAEIEILQVPSVLETCATAGCAVRVRNTGSQTWPAVGPNPVRLAYDWVLPDGRSLTTDHRRAPLPADVRPGEEVTLSCALEMPHSAGEFLLELDLVREPATWFKDRGSAPARLACRVVPGRLPDFGEYEDLWKRVDVESNYYSLVGPGSVAEFESLGRLKRQLLIDLGMTPESRVLDVGCGTGCLTGALLDYLSPRGLYYGTDIGAEPVAFCRKKYGRPNFFFLKNEMTRIPIQGQQFDVIVLFSVFTHLYPAEIGAMLADLERLLAPGGVLLADAFASPEVELFAGNRSKVTVNEGLLRRTFAATGLRFERFEHPLVAGSGPPPFRWFFTFRHAADSGRQAA
jgi:ubiquinone/menaquinone biosynthesis C-methylase UbiE